MIKPLIQLRYLQWFFLATLLLPCSGFSKADKTEQKNVSRLKNVEKMSPSDMNDGMTTLQDSVVEDIAVGPTAPKGQLGITSEAIVKPVEPKTPREALRVAHPDASPIKGRLITLKTALEGAYKQSPLVTAEYEVKAAQMGLSGARREWLPRAGASLSYAGTSGDSVTSRGLNSAGDRSDSQGNTKTGTTEGSLSVQQNLYSGGATTAGILAQQKNLEATIANYNTTTRDTLLAGIKAFINLTTKKEVYRLNKDSQKLLEKQLEVAKNRYEFGELTRYDVASTQAKLDKAKAEVIAALAETEIAKASFVKISGLDVDGPLEKPGYPEGLIPASKSEAVQIALKHSPALKKQDAIAEAAEAEVDKTFGGLLPSFDISAAASRKVSDLYDSRSYFGGHGKTRTEQLEAKATLTIPLDFRGSTQTSVRQKKYVSAQQRLKAIYERRNIMEKVSQEWDTLEAGRARITQLESQIKAGKIALETVNEEFLAGNKTTLDVLSAEQELSSAQVELVKAEQSVIIAAYQLLATMGQLNGTTLNLNVMLYDPKEDYNKMSFWGTGIAPDQRINDQLTYNNFMEHAEATNDF